MKKVSLTLKTIFSLLLMIAFLGMAACAKKSNSGANRVQNRGASLPYNASAAMNGTNSIYNGGQFGQGSCSQSYGRLYDDGSMYGSFQASFAEFLAGTDLGSLDGSPNSTTTGVNIQLKLKMNGQNVVAEQSGIQFEVIDSLALQEDPINPITLPLPGRGVTNDGAVIFGDEYGDVMVKIRNSGNLVQGQVFFKNDGMSQAKPLGSFTMNSCAVFY